MKTALILLVVTGCFACSKKSYIDVAYRLPSAADTLEGRTVFVETRDLRSNTEIFNKRANEKFEHFTGLFSLSLVMSDEQQKILGAYPLPKLFEVALTQRLQKLGAAVSAAPSPSIPVFQININQFHINLVGQKWMADISYEVSLTQDTQRVAREVVSGSAERLKVMGSGGAEKVIGDIFTDMINRLNIERLFQQAKL
jgi:hypothetical protein